MITSDLFVRVIKISVCTAVTVQCTAAVDMVTITTINCDSQRSHDSGQECELSNRFGASEVWLWLVSQGLGLSRARVSGWMGGGCGGLLINGLFGGG